MPMTLGLMCTVCFAFFPSLAYRTVSGVNGPLVILDQVKVRAQCRTRVCVCR